MLRALGAALILGASLAARRLALEEGRRTQRLRRDLAAALEAMEAEIRLLLTPFPSLLRKDYGETCSFFAKSVCLYLNMGRALPEAWRAAAENLPLPEAERRAVSSMSLRLDGDEASVCAALRLTAEELRRFAREAAPAERLRERNITVFSVSIGLLLIILLA